jgi:HlyD family secretion protein
LAHLLSIAYSTELYRFPAVILSKTLVLSAFLVVLFVIAAQTILYRLIHRLDWLAVLNVKEAEKEHARIATLAERGGASHQQLDDAALEAETAVIDLREQEMMRAAFNTLFTAIKLGPEYIDEWLGRKRIEREVVVQQLSQARARLARAEHDLALAAIFSPIDGLVLERFEQGGGPLPSGRPLLRLGNPEELEVVADVL